MKADDYSWMFMETCLWEHVYGNMDGSKDYAKISKLENKSHKIKDIEIQNFRLWKIVVVRRTIPWGWLITKGRIDVALQGLTRSFDILSSYVSANIDRADTRQGIGLPCETVVTSSYPRWNVAAFTPVVTGLARRSRSPKNLWNSLKAHSLAPTLNQLDRNFPGFAWPPTTFARTENRLEASK